MPVKASKVTHHTDNETKKDVIELEEDVDENRAKRDDEEVVEVTSAMPLPAPLPAPIPVPEPTPTKKKGGKMKFLLIIFLLGAIGGVTYYFLG